MAARRQVRKRRRQNLNSRNFKQAYAERRDSFGALERLLDEPVECLHLTTGIAIRGRQSWLIFAVPAGTGLHKFDLLCQDDRPK